MAFLSRRFSGWLNLAFISCLALFLSLSYWQFSRGMEKKQLLATIAQHENLSVTEAQINDLTQNQLAFTEITLKGQFDNEHAYLVENQRHQQQLGYHVVMPFYTESGAYLVNRGWIPRAYSLENLLASEPERVTISGYFYQAKHNWFVFTNEAQKQWPRHVLEVRVDEFSDALGVDFFPMVVNLHNSNHGYAPVTHVKSWLTPEKHWGYSAQWLCFALILIGIYVYFGNRR